MRAIRELIPGALILLLLAALAACGTSAPPGTSGGPSHIRSAASAGPGSASATAPSPTAAASATPTTTPAAAVLSSRVSYPWHWPNDAGNPANIQHSYPVPPLPQLIAISGAPSVATQPPAHLGVSRMASWAPVGDFEGVVTYGIGIAWPDPQPNPQFAVLAIEVETVTASGQHRYIIAIDIDATPPSAQH